VADPGGRAIYGVGVQPLICWDCGFEYPLGHDCLSLVNVVCRQLEFSATGRFLVQRIRTDCVCARVCVCVCVRERERERDQVQQ